MRKKIQKQLPLMETTSGHTQEIELDIISSITDNTPTISDYVLQDLTIRKYDYQINFTQAISKSKDVIALLFQQTTSKLIQLIEGLQNIFLKTIEPIRPGRKYPRRHLVSCRKYFLNYKPIA